PESTMFRAELDALGDDRLTVHHVWSANAGRITTDVVDALTPDCDEVDAWFLCGPTELVDTLEQHLAGQRVLTEVFHTQATATQIDIAVDSRVTVVLDGAESTFALRSSGETVLDAALQQGIDPPYSCAGGACGTCLAKVLLGRAVM